MASSTILSQKTAIPIGVLNMLDYNGEDQKIMAVAARDPRFERVADIDDG